MTISEKLLTIKRLREGQAELALSCQRQRYAKARARTQEAESILQACKDVVALREHAMYGELCSRAVRTWEIEEVLLCTARLRNEAHQSGLQLEDARCELEREGREVAASRERHRQAMQQTRKFLELVLVYREACAKAREHDENLEAEEAVLLAGNLTRTDQSNVSVWL